MDPTNIPLTALSIKIQNSMNGGAPHFHFTDLSACYEVWGTRSSSLWCIRKEIRRFKRQISDLDDQIQALAPELREAKRGLKRDRREFRHKLVAAETRRDLLRNQKADLEAAIDLVADKVQIDNFMRVKNISDLKAIEKLQQKQGVEIQAYLAQGVTPMMGEAISDAAAVLGIFIRGLGNVGGVIEHPAQLLM